MAGPTKEITAILIDEEEEDLASPTSPSSISAEDLHDLDVSVHSQFLHLLDMIKDHDHYVPHMQHANVIFLMKTMDTLLLSRRNLHKFYPYDRLLIVDVSRHCNMLVT
jgi:uncharacterized short protein YbdD (DUF466 family)